MVIHARGNKRKAAHTEHTTADQKRGLALANSKDVPQFAANFSVYVFPPDVVCLYSEDRKFFLHGELYCALAEAIGKGGKSVRALVTELGRRFPADKVQEALTRLFERRYVVTASPSSAGVAAGYWASLGLPPGMAEKNLHELPRAHSSDRRAGRGRTRRRLGRAGRARGQARRCRSDGHAGGRLPRRAADGIEPAASGRPYVRGSWCSRPACFLWWGRCSVRATARVGCVLPTA